MICGTFLLTCSIVSGCEIWKQIPGFSNYEASTVGNVRNKKKQELSQTNLGGGYPRTKIINDNKESKAMTFHQLIALTFIPNPEQKPTVNHKNHNKLDNRIENLEWATVKEQNQHKRKVPREIQRLISSRAVWRIDKKTDKKLELYETIKDAAQWIFDEKLTTITEVNNIKSKISAVCQNHRNYTYGYKWEYKSPKEIKNEIWKPIPKDLIGGVDGYFLSTHSRIKNHKGRISEGMWSSASGYGWVSIYPKQYQLHILMAKVFLPNFYGKPVVNHKDGNKSNSKLYNLEWTTYSENAQHAHDTGLNKSSKPIELLEITTNKIETFKSSKSCSNLKNISINKVRYALKHKKTLDNKYTITRSKQMSKDGPSR